MNCLGLRMIAAHHESVKRHLFPGDGREAAAIGLCGRLGSLPDCRLLVREIHLVPHDICQRTPVSIIWPVSWLDPLLDRAARENLSIVKFHSHPNDYRNFSAVDDRGDRGLFDGVYAWVDRDFPHGSVVMMSDGDMLGRIVTQEGQFLPFDKIAVVGDDVRFYHRLPTILLDDLAEIGRPAAAFGRQMTADLGRLSVMIAGASGTGSIMHEQAGRLGFGRIESLDPQKVELRNLNRVVNATRADAVAGAEKVEVAKQAIEDMGLGSSVEIHPINLVSHEAVQVAARSDIIIGCVDSAEGRDVLNRIATYYLVPYIDVGVGIVALPDGTIDQVNGAVHYLQPGKSSLLSRKAYRPAQVEADALRRKDPKLYAERLKEKYIEGADENAPAVISINMTMAALGMNEVLARLYQIRNAANNQYASTRVNFAEMTMESDVEAGQCLLLSRHVGRGDCNPPLGLPELSV